MNIFFTLVFTFEMIVKIIGLGLHDYLKDPMNIFDGVIVILSLSESLFSESTNGVSILRGFRLMRIFKLMRSWVSLRKVMQVVYRSAPDSANLGLLMLIFIFINALIGKQFFSGVLLDEEDEPTRYSFNTIG